MLVKYDAGLIASTIKQQLANLESDENNLGNQAPAFPFSLIHDAEIFTIPRRSILGHLVFCGRQSRKSCKIH